MANPASLAHNHPAAVDLGLVQIGGKGGRIRVQVASLSYAINLMVVLPHRHLKGDLYLVSPDWDFFGSSRGFTRRRVQQAAVIAFERAKEEMECYGL